MAVACGGGGFWLSVLQTDAEISPCADATGDFSVRVVFSLAWRLFALRWGDLIQAKTLRSGCFSRRLHTSVTSDTAVSSFRSKRGEGPAMVTM